MHPASLSFLFDMDMDAIFTGVALEAFDIICNDIGLIDIETL